MEHQNTIAVIESLDHEGRGVTHVDGKAIFVEGALPMERVSYRSRLKKTSYEFANVEHIHVESSQRVAPKCAHFGVCGGCSLQHASFSSQVAAKQRLLEDNLWHIGRIKPEMMLPPIYGLPWGYRHKARLRVRYVPKKGGALVGFNEKSSSYVADMRSCEVLPPHMSDLISPLRTLVGQLSIRDSLPQIELAIGEANTVLVLRILEALDDNDICLVQAFSEQYAVEMWTQTKGPDTAKPLFPASSKPLYYTLPEYNLQYPFNPTEFTQVNPYINRVMIRRAMQLLSPQRGETIADFFCGLGNFTLPIARSGAQVLGIEGSAALVARAQQGAELNKLTDFTRFNHADLFEMTPEILRELGYFDKWLIDPPRDGALALVKALADQEADTSTNPKRIVYVSCNPSTLARDTAILVSQKGYKLKSAGVINMFPHTSHVESIALFEY